MNNQTPKEEEENWHKDPKNWKLSCIYYNKHDKRIFVPKRIPWMGITLNFAHTKSYITLIAIILFFGFITYMIAKNN
jgi:uncharacterized membrane protein